MKHSGTLSCRWPEYVSRKKGGKLQHTFRGNGVVICSTNRAQKDQERKARGAEILAEAKAKIATERKEKALAKRRLSTMRENPDARVGSVKTDKNGTPYVQPRLGGKFGKRVNLTHG